MVWSTDSLHSFANNPVVSELVSSTQIMDVSTVGRLKEAEGISKGGSALFIFI